MTQGGKRIRARPEADPSPCLLRTLAQGHRPVFLFGRGLLPRQCESHHGIQAIDHRCRDQNRGSTLLGRLINDVHGAQLQSGRMIRIGHGCLDKLSREALLRQKYVLLEELQHRIVNSLQIIAGIILMKARTVKSEETRLHLRDTHSRVMSIAALQKHLHSHGAGGPLDVGPYLAKLCDALAMSMIGDTRPISLQVCGDGGSTTSRQAECLGLIVTELAMNALKHGFTDDRTDGRITVEYDAAGTNWKLSVADNGMGRPGGVFAQVKTGLGTSIVQALAHQLGAHVETLAGPQGTTVSVTRATFSAKTRVA
jgi:two-component sensor histidine kinase